MGQRIIGSFEEAILRVVKELNGTAYGAVIRRTVEEGTGRPVAIGAVYTTLERLQEKGFVKSWMGDPTPERGGRAKRYYRIEGAGELALSEADRARMQLRPSTQMG